MGCHENIGANKFPKQSDLVGGECKVCFNYGPEEFKAEMIRDDHEDPGKTIFLLQDGRAVLATECQYALPQLPPVEFEPVHNWFGLTYAQYLTIPRSVLQSMPLEWQKRFVRLLDQLDESMDWHPKEGRYWVRLKDSKGRYVHDDLMDYERGRRVITPKAVT